MAISPFPDSKSIIPPIIQARRRFIAANVDVSGRSFLEIGALDTPTVIPSDGADIRYMDWFSREEMVARHSTNSKRNTDNLVQVDYVVKTKSLATVIEQRFDLVIANHVIEHIPDVIYWLDQLNQITTEHGCLMLAVPDKRYTFDINRECTDAVELYRCNVDRLDRPTRYQIARHFFYHQQMSAADGWAGKLPSSDARRMTLKQAIDQGERMEAQYADVHCHVFTRDSFGVVFKELQEAGLIRWQIASISAVEKGRNEFHVLLRKSA